MFVVIFLEQSVQEGTTFEGGHRNISKKLISHVIIGSRRESNVRGGTVGKDKKNH